MQKTWNKVRQLQQVTGFTRFSPIWDNNRYSEIAFLQYGARWKRYRITHLHLILSNGVLCSFSELRDMFHLPKLDAVLYTAPSYGENTEESRSLGTIAHSSV